MKTNYLKFTEGEITIYCGVNAMSNCSASLEQAASIARSNPKSRILYLNTFLSTRKVMAQARQPKAPLALNPSPGVPGKGNIIIENIAIGNLANELWRVERMIEEQKITCVIINSWEFAHQSYIYKERAIFALMGMVNKFEVAVLVYSQSKAIKAGKIQRGGLGKLSALATEVIVLETEEKSEQDQVPVMKNKILVDRKINELEYARSKSGISSGGELVLPGDRVESEVPEEDLVLA